MASFSTIATLGLNRLRQKNKGTPEQQAALMAQFGKVWGFPTPITAPAPTGFSLLTPPAPPDAGLAASNAVDLAMLAAKKQRRKAALLVATPTSIATASLQPKTLLGY